MTHPLDDMARLAQIRAFAETRIAPAAAAWSRGAQPETALFEAAAALGLMGLEVPRHLGGQGACFQHKAQAMASLAGADFGFAMSVVNTHNVALRLATTAADRLRDRHLPELLSGRISACTALSEPGAGSDVAALATRASETPDGWVLNGEKTWIVNGRHAGLAIVYAQCASPGDASGIAAFLVDLRQPGVAHYPLDSGFSQTSTGTGGFTLEAVNLPKDAMLLAPGTAFKSILTEINGARAYVAAMCNAMTRTALQEARAYGQQRQSFGKPLAQYARWRAPLDAAEADLDASRELSGKAIQLVEAGADAQLAAAEAKIAAVETAQRHLPELLHAMGAEGLRPERCFARHLAAAQIAGLTDGATNILRERVARLTRRANDSLKE